MAMASPNLLDQATSDWVHIGPGLGPNPPSLADRIHIGPRQVCLAGLCLSPPARLAFRGDLGEVEAHAVLRDVLHELDQHGATDDARCACTSRDAAARHRAGNDYSHTTVNPIEPSIEHSIKQGAALGMTIHIHLSNPSNIPSNLRSSKAPCWE